MILLMVPYLIRYVICMILIHLFHFKQGLSYWLALTEVGYYTAKVGYGKSVPVAYSTSKQH